MQKRTSASAFLFSSTQQSLYGAAIKKPAACHLHGFKKEYEAHIFQAITTSGKAYIYKLVA